MKQRALAILRTGMVTSVGCSAPSSCAAIRSKLSSPSETRFSDSVGEWIIAHQVTLEQPWRGIEKLARMAAMAMSEAMAGLSSTERQETPLLLCVAEQERPGRTAGLDGALLPEIERLLGMSFSHAVLVPHGRVAVAMAMAQARDLVAPRGRALIAAVDSLLNWPTLSYYERKGRLLTPGNSNGFLPGEGAGALLVGGSTDAQSPLQCCGSGFDTEPSHIDTTEPQRAEGLSRAINKALQEAGHEMHNMDFRITDISGEHYYFKEAALALSRTLKRRKDEFDIWHPAECIGETGAVSGAAVIACAEAACAKGYSKGRNILAHMANDGGRRAALVLRSESA